MDNLRDTIKETIKALAEQRLACIRGGPRLTYSVQGRNYSWTEYQQYLSKEIENCLRQLQQLEPFQFTSTAL
jgi:hypothetical protein